MRDSGDLKPEADVPALARAVLAIVQGGFVLMQSSRSTNELATALDVALLVLRGSAAEG
jgi:hypothetical protein